MKIIIDAGHGGNDSGAKGVLFYEKSYVLLIAKKVYEKLQNYNCETFITRSNDTFISLGDRCKKSNENDCDVFVSIHCNSADVNTATGFESYAFYKNTSLQNNLHNEIIKVLPLRDRGQKQANFYVLKHTKARAVLLELGFINNIKDSQILNDHIDEIVNAIVRGLVVECGLSSKTIEACKCNCKCK